MNESEQTIAETPLPVKLTEKESLRLWSKVRKTDTCWLWTGRVVSKYGMFKLRGKGVKPHRLTFVLNGGVLTAEKPFVLHNCPGGDNTLCCNPDHLWAGNADDNAKDCVAKGRSTKGRTFKESSHKGSNNGRAKLNEKIVADIRKQFESPSKGLTSRLANEYGVTRRIIRLIRTRKLWAHI